MVTRTSTTPPNPIMQNWALIVVSFCLLALMTTAGAATPADKITPETSHYFDSFDPLQQPWEPGQPLNIEEVFKNYQYFEILLNRDGREMVVNQYIRGSKTGSEKYRLLPDGSLQRVLQQADSGPP